MPPWFGSSPASARPGPGAGPSAPGRPVAGSGSQVKSRALDKGSQTIHSPQVSGRIPLTVTDMVRARELLTECRACSSSPKLEAMAVRAPQTPQSRSRPHGFRGGRGPPTGEVRDRRSGRALRLDRACSMRPTGPSSKPCSATAAGPTAPSPKRSGSPRPPCGAGSSASGRTASCRSWPSPTPCNSASTARPWWACGSKGDVRRWRPRWRPSTRSTTW